MYNPWLPLTLHYLRTLEVNPAYVILVFFYNRHVLHFIVNPFYNKYIHTSNSSFCTFPLSIQFQKDDDCGMFIPLCDHFGVLEQIWCAWSLFQICSVNPCKSLRLHLVFFNFNIPLLLMFDKNILLVCIIIKHYLSIVYIALIFFVLYVFLYLILSLILSWIENDQNSSL